MLRIVAAKDIAAKIIPKAGDAETQKVMDRLNLDKLEIISATIEVDYNPHTVVIIRGIATIFKKQDADIEIVLANN